MLSFHLTYAGTVLIAVLMLLSQALIVIALLSLTAAALAVGRTASALLRWQRRRRGDHGNHGDWATRNGVWASCGGWGGAGQIRVAEKHQLSAEPDHRNPTRIIG